MNSINITIQTHLPHTPYPQEVIIPNQPHKTLITELVTGKEDLTQSDGIWTRNFDLLLGVETADCAPIAFWDDEKFGIIHAGWRGLVGGICENMLEIFDSSDTQVQVGPILPRFEIQRDFCYDALYEKFGECFFYEEENSVIFDFKSALRLVLPMAKFDGRNTYNDVNLASWRRDKNEKRNITVIGVK